VHGVLVLDKPEGPTSHDVVARVRRALRTREVGHAGTLDPFATGVLVVAVGEATKLVQYLTADDKHYEATIELGRATHTLDRTGETVDTSPVPPLTRETVERAITGFLGTRMQRAPAVSAIKVDGVPLHARVRRGEDVEAPERSVTLHGCELLGVTGDVLRVRMHSGKGYYVRAFARDLAVALGTVGHVKELRRTASGRFGLDVAVTLEALTEPGTAERALLPLPRACACLPGFTLDEKGELDARCGRRVSLVNVAAQEGAVLGEGTRVVLFSAAGSPVAIAEKADEEALRIVRGFAARG
jgi:tRNA pseudouridine55 synthase